MDPERRQHVRYPTWLPAMMYTESADHSVPVRVIDLSCGGAAIEGAFRAPLPGPLRMQIEWFGLVLTLACSGVEWSLDELPPRVRLQFAEVTVTQNVLLTALIAAMAAESNAGGATPAARRGWLRLLPERAQHI